MKNRQKNTLTMLLVVAIVFSLPANIYAATKIKWLDDEPLPYRSVSFDEKNGIWLFCDESWDKFSVLGDDGKPILNDEYEHILSANEDGYTVSDGSYNIMLIDKEGNVKVTNHSYYQNYYSDYIIKSKKDNKFGTTDIYGNIKVPHDYEFLWVLSDNIIKTLTEPEKYGLVDSEGNILIPNEYDVLVDKSDNVFMAIKDKKYGILDRNGNVILPFEYDGLDYKSDDVIIVKKGNNSGIVDINNNIVLPLEYDSLIFESSDAVIAEKDGKFGIVNIYGNIRLPFIYSSISYYSDNIIGVTQNGVVSYIDINRNVKFENIRMREYYSDNVFVAMDIKTLDCAIYDIEGNMLSGYNLTGYHKYYSDNIIIVKKNDKYGIIDMYGNEILPFVYKEISYYESNGYVLAEQSYGHWYRGIVEQVDFETSPEDQFVLYIDACYASVWGEEKYNDVAPIILNNRTMLPARFVAENLDAEVEWDRETKKVTVTKNDTKIEMIIGSDIIYVNGEASKMDSSPVIKKDRTYVPIRFLAEALECSVDWIEESQSVIIKRHFYE